MIPPILVKNFGPTLAKVIFWGFALALLLVVLGLAKCTYDRSAKTEIRLSKGQAGAAVASGSDAVGTLGNRMQADAAGDQIVEEATDNVQKAVDARGVTAAGRSGLCQLAGYRRKPECMR